MYTHIANVKRHTVITTTNIIQKIYHFSKQLPSVLPTCMCPI